MPKVSDYFFRAAILFLVVGIAIGLHMSISQNHDVIGAHAHMNLLGWVTSALFGTYYALNPAKAQGLLPVVHFWLYTVGVAVMSGSLYFVLKGNTALVPVLSVSSLVTAVGVLLAAYVIFTPARSVAGFTAQPAE